MRMKRKAEKNADPFMFFEPLSNVQCVSWQLTKDNMLLLLLTLICSNLSANLVIAAGETNVSDIYNDYRLPTTQMPSKYQINLKVEKDVFVGNSTSFNGTVVIIFNVTESINIVKLHSGVTINYLELKSSESIIPYENLTLNSTLEILTILLTTDLSVSTEYTLLINFTGELDTADMQGIYRSYYDDEYGLRRYLVSTQLEATNARRVFPCFDEPSYKAEFALNITYPRGLNLTALSNVPQRETPILVDDDYEKASFKDTPKMSTYLVALTLFDFTCTLGQNISGNIPHQVCSRNETAEQRSLAVEYGTKFLEVIGEYLGIPYSEMMIGKMDQIALPDFSANAMENWGMVTYREAALLYDSNETSNSYKQQVISIVAHEFAHMWFGNLVTLDWWDNTFLNGGFARYFQYWIQTKISGLEKYEMDKQFVIRVQQSVLSSDALITSPSLTSKAVTPLEIKNKFGLQFYNKGASIIKMVESLMPETFNQSLQAYIQKYQFSTTTPEDLWNVLSNYTSSTNLPSNTTLTQVMGNWTNEAGFPLVTVTADGSDVIFTQRRFLYNGSDDTQWYIPISYTIFIGSNNLALPGRIWLLPGNDEIILSNVLLDDSWIIINTESSGYYRVHYDTTLWKKIEARLNNDQQAIDDITKSRMINDILNLARANELTYAKAFEKLSFLKYDTSYYSWYSAIEGFDYLVTRLGEKSVLGMRVGSMLLNLMKTVKENITFDSIDGENHIYSLKVQKILSTACILGDGYCVSTARKLFKEYKNGISIDKNIRHIVYCNALRYSNDIDSDWNFLWSKLRSTSQANELSNIITSLGCTTNSTYLKYYLAMSVDVSSGIRVQNVPDVWSSVYSSSYVGVDAAFDYLSENYELISNYFSKATNLLPAIVDRFSSKTQVEKLATFIEQLNTTDSSIKSKFEVALKTAEDNLEWASGIVDDLNTYFYRGYLLPTTQLPSKYSIHLEMGKEVFNGNGSSFNGTVDITFNVTKSINTIQLHSAVTINNLELKSAIATIPYVNYTLDSKVEILTILLTTTLNVSTEYTLTITYSGELNTTDTLGFYRSYYENSAGAESYFVTTHLHPTRARKVFPCFDEPHYKANFAMNITYPRGLNLTAMSNTAQSETSSDLSTDYETISFEETPKMSTYLVAFTVSDFTCTAGGNIDVSIPHQVCSRKETASQRTLATEYGTKLMRALEDCLGITYSEMTIGKMDQIAFTDFTVKAMENWGIVSYEEKALLYDSNETSNYDKQTIISTIAHEFSHSWFGNLVTLNWYDYTFLNEGFARYLQYWIQTKVSELQKYEMDKQFVIEVQQSVFLEDASTNSQSLTSESVTPTEIGGKFDKISYDKGASVIRMVEGLMTENFNKSLNAYLRKYNFSTTVPDDLWNVLSDYVPISNLPNGVSLTKIMDTWTNEAGFPLVTVTSNGSNVILSQKRFSYNGSDYTQWHIPINYEIFFGSNNVGLPVRTWLLPGDNLTIQNILMNDSWIIVNTKASGYYRVIYDTASWSRIESVLQKDRKAIDNVTRSQIIDDNLNFARAGVLSYTEAFSRLNFLKYETCYYPWYSAIEGFNYLITRLGENSEMGTRVRSMLLEAMETVKKNITFESIDEDNHMYTLKVQKILTQTCKLEDEYCVTNTRKLYKDYKKGISIDKNMRRIVYSNALRYSEDINFDWNFLWSKLHSLGTSQTNELFNIITSLGCTRNKEYLKFYLEQSLNTSSILRIQYLADIWSSVYKSSTEGVDVAFDFLTENYESIQIIYPKVTNLLSAIVDRFSSETQVKKLEEFVNLQSPSSPIRATCEAMLKTAKQNLVWVSSIESDLRNYYKIASNSAATTYQLMYTIISAAILLEILI
ncbi:hypothetical protein JTB14_037969 [Gonioctena quinquepunctata]|nr:hypothetical protein JTB14_037969 [Gonioctena quinquepunctata]